MIIRALSAIVLAIGLLSGPATTAQVDAQTPVRIADAKRTAPELIGITHWFNAAPLKLADLRGKVVLVDFWTYGCINCVNTLPHLTRLQEKYKDMGLVIIGVHSPEFAFEKSTTNVAAAIKRHGITYPVAQDNEFATWDAYRNRFWPAQYIVDKAARSYSSMRAKAPTVRSNKPFSAYSWKTADSRIDILIHHRMAAFGGKADMGLCAAHVRL
jgi:thiol-disulfide isomerase/thioredoxin